MPGQDTITIVCSNGESRGEDVGAGGKVVTVLSPTPC